MLLLTKAGEIYFNNDVIDSKYRVRVLQAIKLRVISMLLMQMSYTSQVFETREEEKEKKK
jgi:hypothetical protein